MSLLGGIVSSAASGAGGPSGPVTVKEVTVIKEITELKRVNNVSIKALPCPKINDKGLTGAWWWADKIAMAVSLWATAETWKASKEEYNIGKRYFDLAKDQWDFFRKFYRPLEEQELDEIWAELPHTPDYTTAVNGHTNLIDNVFNTAEKHRKALADKYCICSNVSHFMLTDIMKSTVGGDSDNFARRYADQLAKEKNDIRWARRISAASRGRGLLSDSTSLASKAAGFYSDYAQAMGGLASNAQQFRGYINNRSQTVYNEDKSRINSRADVPDTYRGFDAQAYWQNASINEETPRGGLSWTMTEGQAPYMHSGFDPAGYSTQTR